MFTVQSGRQSRPTFTLLYGPPGVGKTDFASAAPNCLIGDCEEGSTFLDVDRIRISSFDELLKAFVWFVDQPFDTFVADSTSAIERFVIAHTLAERGWKNLDQPGFGKGYKAVRENWLRILKGIDWLKSHGKSVIMIAHSKVKSVNDPQFEPFDRFEFDCDKETLTTLVAATDGCFFMRYQIRIVENDSKKAHAVGSGAREIHTTDRAGSLGKSRFNHLPIVLTVPHGVLEARAVAAEFWQSLKS